MLDWCGGEEGTPSKSVRSPSGTPAGSAKSLSLWDWEPSNTFPAITEREKGWSWFLFPQIQEGSSTTQLRNYFPGHPEKLKGPGKKNFGDPLVSRRAESGQERSIIPQAVITRCWVCSPFLFTPPLQGPAVFPPETPSAGKGSRILFCPHLEVSLLSDKEK